MTELEYFVKCLDRIEAVINEAKNELKGNPKIDIEEEWTKDYTLITEVCREVNPNLYECDECGEIFEMGKGGIAVNNEGSFCFKCRPSLQAGREVLND